MITANPFTLFSHGIQIKNFGKGGTNIGWGFWQGGLFLSSNHPVLGQNQEHLQHFFQINEFSQPASPSCSSRLQLPVMLGSGIRSLTKVSLLLEERKEREPMIFLFPGVQFQCWECRWRERESSLYICSIPFSVIHSSNSPLIIQICLRLQPFCCCLLWPPALCCQQMLTGSRKCSQEASWGAEKQCNTKQWESCNHRQARYRLICNQR